MPSFPLKAGLLGAGTIATSPGGFLPGLTKFPELVTLQAIADPVFDRAQAVGKQFGVPEAYPSLDAMLESDIDLVVNITPIPFHASTSKKILEAGKHLAIEKPIATTLEEADELIAIAKEKGLTYVVAPPNQLLQNRTEARNLVKEGAIGQIAFARVRSSHGGPAAGAWPLDPTWFYQKGSGPLLDMGVYGIHDITGILGPAKRVVAFSGITEPVRTVRKGPFAGTKIEVTEDDNTLLMLDFGNSCFAVIDGTYNVNAARGPMIEIFGRTGTINLGNAFSEGGEVPSLEIFKFDALPGVDGWISPSSHGAGPLMREWNTYQRSVIVKHLAECVRDGVHPILSAEHARHALEIMVKAIESARTGQAVELTTTF